MRHLARESRCPQLPLTLEPNLGQGIEGTDYLARSGALPIGLSAGRMELRMLSDGDRRTAAISLANSNTHAPLVASERGTGESNYLLGSDVSAWRTHIPQYQSVTYGSVYPGVDLTFYGNGEKVEHDFVVQPGSRLPSDQDAIRGCGSTVYFTQWRPACKAWRERGTGPGSPHLPSRQRSSTRKKR